MKGENSNSHILDKNNSCISCTQLLINVVLKSNYFSCSFLKLTTLELILEEKKIYFSSNSMFINVQWYFLY